MSQSPHNRPFRRTRWNTGFTLVELLVGLSLLALISILLFGGFRFGLRAWETADREITVAGSIERAQDLLRRQLSQTQPPALVAEAGRVRVIPTLRGASTSLVFVAPLPAHRGFGGLHVFTLKIESGDEGDRLLLTWRPFTTEDRPSSGPEDHAILIEGIRSLEFSYFGRTSSNAPAQWIDRWENPEILPRLVRIRVELEDGRDETWPDLVVAPKLGLGHG